MNEEFVKIAYEILSELSDGNTTDERAAQIQQWLVRNIHHPEVDEALSLYFDQLVDEMCFDEQSCRLFELAGQRPGPDTRIEEAVVYGLYNQNCS